MDFETEQKYWGEILDMCMAPAQKHGFKCRIVQEHEFFQCPKVGRTGVIRPFNPVDFARLYAEFDKAIEWFSFSFQKIPNMKAVFDFFPFEIKDGKRRISTTHFHIEQSQFKILDTQISMEL